MTDRWLERRMRPGDYADYGVEFYTRNRFDLLKLFCVYHLPVLILCIILINPGAIFATLFDIYNDNLSEGTFFRMFLGISVLGTYFNTAYYALQGSVSYYTYNAIVLDRKPPLKETLKAGFRRFGWCVLFAFLQSIIISMTVFIAWLAWLVIFAVTVNFSFPILIGVTVIILGALITAYMLVLLLYRFMYVYPAIFIGANSATKAMGVSFKLTKGKKWPGIKYYVLTEIICLSIPALSSFVSDIFSFSSSSAVTLVYVITACIAGVFSPLFTAMVSVRYIMKIKENGTADYGTELNDFFAERGIGL